MDAPTPRKSPSQRIIEAFGGIRETARRFDKPPTTVQHWYDTAIPARHQSMFLNEVTKDGWRVSPADFFDMTSDDSSEPDDGDVGTPSSDNGSGPPPKEAAV